MIKLDSVSEQTGQGLKPCPFCGSNDIDYGIRCGTMRGVDYVQCENCGAEINAVHNADGFIAAEELWNRRSDNG